MGIRTYFFEGEKFENVRMMAKQPVHSSLALYVLLTGRVIFVLAIEHESAIFPNLIAFTHHRRVIRRGYETGDPDADSFESVVTLHRNEVLESGG